jgi:hypothetical protein
MSQSMIERAAVAIEIDYAIKSLDDAIKTASSYDFSDDANALLASQISRAHHAAVVAWQWIECSLHPALPTLDAMSAMTRAVYDIASAQKMRASKNPDARCLSMLRDAKSSLSYARHLLGGGK